MHDFRLQVFYSVATHLNFSRAAGELNISQPAVTQHIKELERIYEARFFERKGNKILLTVQGEKMLEYTEKLISLYRQLDTELKSSGQQLSGQLRIGASTTIAQYVLPQIIAGFYRRYPDVRITLTSDNTENITKALLAGKIDLGLVEGPVHSRDLKLELLMNDELVAVTSSKNELAKSSSIAFEELQLLPWVLREKGSGTREVTEQGLESIGLPVQSIKNLTSLGSTEAIKSFLEVGVGISILSKKSIKNELALGLLQILPISGLNLERPFNFIYPQGPRPAGITGEFIRFGLKFNK